MVDSEMVSLVKPVESFALFADAMESKDTKNFAI